MKITFSSVFCRDSCTVYRVSFGASKQRPNNFTIISHAPKDVTDFAINGKVEALIQDNVLALTTNDKRLPKELNIGNKCLNQLKLGLLGYNIPDTVALDFSFSTVFNNTHKIDLTRVHKKYIAKQLGPAIVIRCSSNLEDGERRSFAGVFDTYLDVPNELKVFKDKILRAYRKFGSKDNLPHDISDYEIKLGIMIQTMVKTRFSGFLFTTDPMNPPNNWLKIEYWQGQREASEGYCITLNSENGKRIRTSRDYSKIPLPPEVQEQLYHTARDLHTRFGFPQDAEFVLSDEDNKLYMVQSRPVTAFSYSPDKVRFEEQNRLAKILQENQKLYHRAPILSSTNISELFVRAIPLGYSIFKYGFAGTRTEEGGISVGRARLGYAKLDLEDQAKFFYTVADQARTNMIVDALTFRLPGIGKADYLNCFVAYYLNQMAQNPNAALYPEDGLYLQYDVSEQWQIIAGDKAETLRKEYADFLQRIIDFHVPQEYKYAKAFFEKNEKFYREHLRPELYDASKNELLELVHEILAYLRTEFCPQYVVFARIAFLSTHVAKQKLNKLLPSETKLSSEQVLNELLSNAVISKAFNELDYAHFERLVKAGKIRPKEFLDKFEHLGSLDISQPRLGEYLDLNSIFGTNRYYEHGDGRLKVQEERNEINPEVAALGLAKEEDFRKWYTAAGRFMHLREKAKFELLKVLYVLKLALKEITRFYRLGDLVYYLEYDEVLELTDKNCDEFRRLALERQAYFAACKQHRVKDVLTDLESFPFEKSKIERDKRYKFAKGQSIFYGYAEGICLTAQTNEEYLRKLATYRKDGVEQIIGVFKGVEQSYFNLSALAGFTTQSGGFLAHAATIAREFKIPYITGIKIDQFQDGDYVIIDTENEQVIFRR